MLVNALVEIHHGKWRLFTTSPLVINELIINPIGDYRRDNKRERPINILPEIGHSKKN